MIPFQSMAMADISDITRPKASGKMVDTRVAHPPKEPTPDYDKMRRVVHGEADVNRRVSNERSEGK
jgi:hypothetical protein